MRPQTGTPTDLGAKSYAPLNLGASDKGGRLDQGGQRLGQVAPWPYEWPLGLTSGPDGRAWAPKCLKGVLVSGAAIEPLGLSGSFVLALGLGAKNKVFSWVRLSKGVGPAPQAKAPYRLNLNERMMLKDALEELINQGFIRPSKSPYGAPALFVSKKDGTLRLYADYRALNKQTVKNRYPLPHMDDLFDYLSGARKFSKVDLRSGYYQIRMAKGDEYKTAMRTRFGSFEFLVMPFGLCNAIATFMKMMNTIFHDLLDQGVLVFIDDILVYSRTLEEHEQLLKEVFRRLCKAHLFAKTSKCEFAMEEIQFLGHTFTKDGITPSQDKLSDIKGWE
ncbi:unnamed protein product [Calypogeia fissa]